MDMMWTLCQLNLNGPFSKLSDSVILGFLSKLFTHLLGLRSVFLRTENR